MDVCLSMITKKSSVVIKVYIEGTSQICRYISNCQYDHAFDIGDVGGGGGGGGGFPTKQTRTIYCYSLFCCKRRQSKLENTRTRVAMKKAVGRLKGPRCTVIHDYSRSIIDCTSGIFNVELGKRVN